MPDGEDHKVLALAKIFKSGRNGLYAQIPTITYDDELWGGQIQIWKK